MVLVSRALSAHRADNPTARPMSRLCRQCEILNISQPFRHPQPVTGIALFLYVDYVRTSQVTLLWTSTASYGDSFTFYLYMIFVPHRKYFYRSPRPVTEIALFYVDYIRT
jgi:hypothetical protein